MNWKNWNRWTTERRIRIVAKQQWINRDSWLHV